MDEEIKTLVELFRGLDTPAVSDALDKVGLPGQCHGIAPLDNYRQPVCGPAFTVKYVPSGQPPGFIGEYQDEVPPGAVVMADNGGRTDCTVWGDIMTQWAKQHHFAATVIDGVCRDVMKAIDDGYPMFTRGRYMRTGKDRAELAGVNVPVSIGGVRVRPGDIVVADANGVVVVRRERAAEVAKAARHIEEVEASIRAAISNGQTLAQAREALGYHLLQRRQA